MNIRTDAPFAQFERLNTPQKIQDFLDSIPFNRERKGETCMSPVRVLQEKKAHCIEGALFACVCLMKQGEKPLIVNLKVEKEDDDHIITLFQKNGYYGAISKTNHAVLRYRDPIYRTVRELVMSYVHEYYLVTTGKKTLLGHTKPINMRRFGTKWMTAEKDLWDIAEKIYDTPCISVVPLENRRYIRNAQAFERKVAGIPEWK